jgi:pSer/pThr/pTyr-binding forkhead associated (FHA) protein
MSTEQSAGRTARGKDKLPGKFSSHYLEVLSGPEDGKVFALWGELVTIGRESDNDVCVPLELSISRHHARLVKAGDGYKLDVLSGARNGAIVGRQPMKPGETASLEKSDVFELGNVSFLLGGPELCQG